MKHQQVPTTPDLDQPGPTYLSPKNIGRAATISAFGGATPETTNLYRVGSVVFKDLEVNQSMINFF